MARIIGKGYSYDDVLIIPKYNKVLSRKDVNFETFVTKNHKIKIPILAANMIPSVKVKWQLLWESLEVSE